MYIYICAFLKKGACLYPELLFTVLGLVTCSISSYVNACLSDPASMPQPQSRPSSQECTATKRPPPARQQQMDKGGRFANRPLHSVSKMSLGRWWPPVHDGVMFKKNYAVSGQSQGIQQSERSSLLGGMEQLRSRTVIPARRDLRPLKSPTIPQQWRTLGVPHMTSKMQVITKHQLNHGEESKATFNKVKEPSGNTFIQNLFTTPPGTTWPPALAPSTSTHRPVKARKHTASP